MIAHVAWIAVSVGLCGSAAWADELNSSFEGARRIQDQQFDRIKALKDPRSPEARAITRDAGEQRGVALRNPMLKSVSERNEAEIKRQSDRLKDSPEMRELKKAASEVRANQGIKPSEEQKKKLKAKGGKRLAKGGSDPNPAARPSALPEAPVRKKKEIVLDGSKIPKELEFGKKPEAAEPAPVETAEPGIHGR